MRLLILGASGRTGRLVTEYSSLKGYNTTAIIRDAQQRQSGLNKVRWLVGSPSDRDILSEGMSDADAIINVLNISRKSDFPWSAVRTPETLVSDVIKMIIELAPSCHINRIVSCSAWGVSETMEEIPGWFRWIVNNSNIGKAYADHERHEAILKSSDLGWTIVRPTGLTNSLKQETIKISYSGLPSPALTISRTSVARFMVDAVNDDELIGKAPVISGER